MDHVAGQSSGNGGLYFIVGALVVAVGVIAYLTLGGPTGGSKNIDVQVEVPKAAPKKPQ